MANGKLRFNLGKLVFTRGVNDLVADNTDYAKQVLDSIIKYQCGEWGDLCEEDKQTNEDALKYGERLLGRYDITPEPIYIITEWDRSATTVLFPREY